MSDVKLQKKELVKQAQNNKLQMLQARFNYAC